MSNLRLVLLLVILSGISVFVDADEKPLIIGSEQNYPPFALGLTDDTADGFTVELWREVAKESHLNSTIHVRPFHEILQDFKAGKIDVLINLAQSDERRQFADFTVPHVIVHGAIFVRNGENSIHTEADLNGKSIIVLNADLAHDYAISKGWEKQLVLVDTSEQGFQLLATGRHDALLLSKLVGKQTLEKLNLDNIEALPVKVGFAQKFSFAVHKGNAVLLAKINEGLALTKANGVYDRLYEKWFGVYEEKALLPLLLKYLVPIIGFFLLIISISFYRRNVERRQAMQALQKSESRFRGLFENAPLPYQALDIEGQLLYVNEAWLALIGCSREQAIGQFFDDFVNISSKPLWATTLTQIKKDNAKGGVVLELVCSDDRENRLVMLKWQVARDNHQQFQRTHCILNDITERHRAEQELKESEQRFRLLADFAPVFIWQTDVNGLCNYVNQVWLDFVGCTLKREEEPGNDWLRSLHVDDYQACLNIYQTAFAKRQAFQMIYRLRRYDGIYRWVFDTGVPRFAEDNSFLGYIGSGIDITERYLAEQALKDNQAMLAVVHADLLQFTHIAAHHLQEPTRRLVTFVQRLQSQLAEAMPVLDDDIMNSLVFIEQSALRQRALVRDIQLYIAAIKPLAVVERISVMSTLAKVLRHHAQRIREIHACIDYAVLPPVTIDPPRLYDIFNILLDNALRYRHAERTLQIQISAKVKAGRVYYRVADNGIGIPADCRERVFLVFERLQVSKNPESTGIGLAIVQRIVNSCQGTVSLEETPNGGTTVLFDLPE
jgi:PAS domain S-box-containing protein